MIRLVLELIAAIGFWIASRKVSSELKPELIGMALGVAVALLVEVVVMLVKERKYLRIYWSAIPFSGRKEIRLTVAYLYKIEVKGKFLLVRSNRIPGGVYQPVGGVYKYFDPEATKDLTKMGITSDVNIPPDDDSEFDLRLRMKNRINLMRFLSWFRKGEEREIDPWREFYEELVKPGLLPQDKFGYIFSELIGQDVSPIKYDERFRMDTFKYADIYKPKFISNEQQKCVSDLQEKKHDEYVWATEDEILRNRTNDGRPITEHSRKIFCTRRY